MMLIKVFLFIVLMYDLHYKSNTKKNQSDTPKLRKKLSLILEALFYALTTYPYPWQYQHKPKECW